MEMRLRAPVTRGYFFSPRLGSLRNIDQKKISSGTQGSRCQSQASDFRLAQTLRIYLPNAVNAWQ